MKSIIIENLLEQKDSITSAVRSYNIIARAIGYRTITHHQVSQAYKKTPYRKKDVDRRFLYSIIMHEHSKRPILREYNLRARELKMDEISPQFLNYLLADPMTYEVLKMGLRK